MLSRHLGFGLKPNDTFSRDIQRIFQAGDRRRLAGLRIMLGDVEESLARHGG